MGRAQWNRRDAMSAEKRARVRVRKPITSQRRCFRRLELRCLGGHRGSAVYRGFLYLNEYG